MNCSLFFVRKVGLPCRLFDLTEVHGFVLIDNADMHSLYIMQILSVQHGDIV